MIDDIKEQLILGLPIETKLGKCKPLKVRDYPSTNSDLQYISLTKNHIINKFSEAYKDGSQDSFINELYNYSLLEIVCSVPEIFQSYLRIFDRMFEEHAFQQITEDNFSFYRELILTMNCIKEEEINPNPEIQRAIERSKRVKAQESGNIDLGDIVSSVVAGSGITYDMILDFTVYQLYMTFHRIGQYQNYNTSTLFATVAGDKVKIDSWNKHIDLFANEKHAISQSDFKKNFGNTFSNS
ncbi:hypothetical protein LCM23_06170 [Cytobacillus kochii]|uniref:hypothetical protein n=1 Tax=Cytobacillus kochii TaxID=859143 RepID=UPI001CD62FF2|nr:hypothetical protein [Cytobacillus kochii]MCA1025670.1 hypothetical protein [Cytobacillus kochii]